MRTAVSDFLAIGAIVTLDAAPAAAQAAADNPAMYRGPDRQQRLIEGARKEGQVTVYSSMIADQALRPILNGFEAKYPFVKPQYVRDDPPQQLQKVMAEARAGRMVVDVLESTGLEVPVRAADIDQPFWSPQIEAYKPERRDPNNYWAPTRFSYLGACYNTNLVKPGEVPKSFEDFLDPKWKGKIAWSSTVIGAMLFITGVRNFMGEEKALAYLQEAGDAGCSTDRVGQPRRGRSSHGRRTCVVSRRIPPSSDHQRAQGRPGCAAAA